MPQHTDTTSELAKVLAFPQPAQPGAIVTTSGEIISTTENERRWAVRVEVVFDCAGVPMANREAFRPMVYTFLAWLWENGQSRRPAG